jgi:hypothetical protein
MRNHHTSDASIDDAVNMFKAGRATIEEAAKACGIPLGTLGAHLTGIEVMPGRSAHATRALIGSPRTCSREPKAAERARPKSVKSKAHATDHFVFYQEKGRWLWDRMSDCNDVVRTCQHSFATYLDCVNNAKKYGWKGTPWFFLRPATDAYRRSRKSLRRSQVSQASSLRAV